MSDAVHRRAEGRRSRSRAGAFRRIVRDNSGNVLPLTAAGMLVLTGLIGGGVDMARAYKAERRLQAACDAGVLAGRRAVTTGGFDATAEAQARAYFAANYDQVGQQTADTLFTPISNDNGNTIEATATATLPTIIMSVFGYNSIDIGVSCAASMGVGNSDIMFVLDNTGSMAWAPNGQSWFVPTNGTRIYALKEAMKSFYDTVQASVAGSNARIRYGFVPYSSAVNVGQLLYTLNPGYLADSITVQSAKLVNWRSTPIRTWTDNQFTYTSASYGSWSKHSSTAYSNSNCDYKVPRNTSWSDSGSPSEKVTYSVDNSTGNQIKTIGIHQDQSYTEYNCQREGYWGSYYIYKRTVTREKRSSRYEERTPIDVTSNNATFEDAILQQRTISTSLYKTFAATPTPTGINSTGTRTSFSSSTWEGCIVERDTVAETSFSFDPVLKAIKPTGAHDLNIDSAPNSEATKWRPLWPEVTYSRNASNAFEGIANSNASFNRNTYNNARAGTYCPRAAQLLAEMTKQAFDGYADSLHATGSTYHDIGLLWGARLSSPEGIFHSNVGAEPGNGGTVSRHLIFMTDGELEPSLTVNSSYGLERLDQRITGGSTGNQWSNHRSRFLAICEAIKFKGIRLWVIAFGTGLTTDLTTCGSPSSSFQANNAEQLHASFQEIANQVGELRVVQ